MPACMMPGPAPVMTIHPSLGQAVGDLAWRRAYSGSSSLVRADPKMVTFGVSVRVGEHRERVAHLLQRGGGDLQVERVGVLLDEVDRGVQQLLGVCDARRRRTALARAARRTKFVGGRRVWRRVTPRQATRAWPPSSSSASSSSSKLFWKLATPSRSSLAATSSRSTPTAVIASHSLRGLRRRRRRSVRASVPWSANASMVASGSVFTVSGPISLSTYSVSGYAGFLVDVLAHSGRCTHGAVGGERLPARAAERALERAGRRAWPGRWRPCRAAPAPRACRWRRAGRRPRCRRG